MKLIRIGCNHNSTCTKLENLDDIFNQGQKIASFVSLVSARNLKCPCSARNLHSSDLSLVICGQYLRRWSQCISGWRQVSAKKRASPLIVY